MPSKSPESTASEKSRSSNVPEWITAVSTLVIAVGGIITLIFAMVQIHELREEASFQHLLDRIHEFEGSRFSAVRKELAANRMDKTQKRLRPLDTDDPPVQMEEELNFCEDLGLLTMRGALDRHDVWNEFAYWLFPFYADARPLVDREQSKSPATYRECSDMVERIGVIEKQEDAGADDHPSDANIYDFYSSEIDNQSGERSRLHKRTGK